MRYLHRHRAPNYRLWKFFIDTIVFRRVFSKAEMNDSRLAWADVLREGGDFVVDVIRDGNLSEPITVDDEEPPCHDETREQYLQDELDLTVEDWIEQHP